VAAFGKHRILCSTFGAVADGMSAGMDVKIYEFLEDHSDPVFLVVIKLVVVFGFKNRFVIDHDMSPHIHIMRDELILTVPFQGQSESFWDKVTFLSLFPYKMQFQVVRFKITENTYECLITTLEESEFSAKDLKEVYHLRWSEENGFRQLK
jgi:hypothetical protein